MHATPAHALIMALLVQRVAFYSICGSKKHHEHRSHVLCATTDSRAMATVAFGVPTMMKMLMMMLMILEVELIMEILLKQFHLVLRRMV